MSISILIRGFVLGWSVAWPPGPVNAEMLRRSVLPPARGGGFAAAFLIGLGACTGDFLWAFGVATGAGALVNTPRIRAVLSVVSLGLLLVLAIVFARSAWRTFREKPTTSTVGEKADANRDVRRNRVRGYFLGFTMAVTSPWNLGFWLAVIGGQQAETTQQTLTGSLILAASVVFGAATWGLVLCLIARHGGRLFSRPSWQVTTQALTSAIMLFFAAKLALHLR